ncbi:MAG: hypothetical protein CM15mP74_08360 [Halieaceae bacterium]|nr:MAG: hypothetical protein CM15mP74_08360 [Halieaceae bacterium]
MVSALRACSLVAQRPRPLRLSQWRADLRYQSRQRRHQYCGFRNESRLYLPCSSGDKAIGTVGLDGWETVEFPVIDLVLGGLNLQSVNTGLVIFPVAGQTDGVVYRLDNIEWKATTGAADSPVAGTWKIASEAGALKVGPGEFDGSWWQLGTQTSRPSLSVG